MMNKNRFVLGAAAALALTTVACGDSGRSEKSRAEWQAETAQANALARAEAVGFQRAACLAYAEGLLKELPEDRMVRAAQAPLYEAQANCPQGTDTKNPDGREIYIWIPTTE